MYFTKCRKCWDDLSVCTCNDDQHKKEETKIKIYLLIAGDNYYPQSGTGDWIDFFDSYEEAKKEIEEQEDGYFKIRERTYDWYEIVNLDNWKETLVKR